MYSVCIEVGNAVDHLIRAIAFYSRERLRVWLPRNCLGSEDVLLKEDLLDEFLQVSSKGQQWMVGVSIGRFGSIFANFYKTEPNRLDLATEPNRTDSVRFFSFFG